MWNTAELKANAKAALKKFGYWKALFATAIAGIFTESLFSGFSNSSGSSSSDYYSPDYYSGTESYQDGFLNIYEEVLDFMASTGILAFILVAILAFALTWAAFLGGPVAVGRNRFFMEHRAFGSKIGSLFYAFKSGNYLNVVKTMFIYEIKIFLWTLLFFIPGVIKECQYFMVPYIMAENPNMDTKRAFEISKLTTKGEKANIWILGLTFIGWILLGTLTCGIGMIFFEPYYRATYAELYQVMREKALGLGYAAPEELPGFFPEEA